MIRNVAILFLHFWHKQDMSNIIFFFSFCNFFFLMFGNVAVFFFIFGSNITCITSFLNFCNYLFLELIWNETYAWKQNNDVNFEVWFTSFTIGSFALKKYFFSWIWIKHCYYQNCLDLQTSQVIVTCPFSPNLRLVLNGIVNFLQQKGFQW